MRASFAAAGFDDATCRFSVFDNREANTHEAYRAFNQAMEETQEPYVIFCHQDILLDRGCGCAELRDIIQDLERTDPDWAVLGNAGVTKDHQVVLRVHDPFSIDWDPDHRPVKVCSLDENFLVIKTASGLRCSENLHGFHLYATDLCLQAAQAKRTCYVVGFYLTHLSTGRLDDSFFAARAALQAQWNRRFRFRYVGTVCTTLFLSRSKAARLVFGSSRVTRWLFASPLRHKLICRLSD